MKCAIDGTFPSFFLQKKPSLHHLSFILILCKCTLLAVEKEEIASEHALNMFCFNATIDEQVAIMEKRLLKRVSKQDLATVCLGPRFSL